VPYCDRCGSETPHGALYCQICGVPVKPRSESFRADWGERLIAWVIDFTILSLALGAIAFTTRISPDFIMLPWTHHVIRWGPFGVLHVKSLIFFGYWTFMEYAYGQSLGKMVMGLRVEDVAGGRIDLSQAAVESFGKAMLLPLDLLAGLALYPWRMQRLTSIIARTAVVRDNPYCCPVEPIRI
jgi:uncharacterized RDD family membrane protein YckC